MRGEVALLLDRVIRAGVGDGFGEHGFHRGVDAGGDLHPGERVELGRQVPHAVGVDPGRAADVAALPGETVHAVVVLQPVDLEVDPAGELVDRAGGGDVDQRVGTVEQLAALEASSFLEVRVRRRCGRR